MKICTFERNSFLGKIKRLGLFFNESTIIDVNALYQLKFEQDGYFNASERAHHKAPSSLHAILSLKENPIIFFQATLELYKDLAKKGFLHTKSGADISFDLKDDKEAKLACPMDKITSYRDFYIHEKHVAKGFEKRGEAIPEAWYEMPVYYKGSTSGFIGDGDDIIWPHYSDKLDYELELGCVLMKDGKNISEKNALDYVFGFTILNDISARDIQKKEMAVRLGPAKGKDFCSILGPVITTMDEFNFKEPDLEMSAAINGELWSQGRSSDANFTWSQIIAHASMEEYLLAGDLLGSGTVGTGCGLELDKWIQPGDKIELYIEKIGKLTNIVMPKNRI